MFELLTRKESEAVIHLCRGRIGPEFEAAMDVSI